MSNNYRDDAAEKKKTNEAWARLQDKIATEPINPIWADWSNQSAEVSPKDKTTIVNGVLTDATIHTVAPIAPLVGIVQPTSKRTLRKGMSRRRKWATIAAGVTVFAAILATPVGNTAMASILNQFRMQDVTVVNEEDLRGMFNEISNDGSINESTNKFGTFSSKSGAISGEMSVDKISDTLGYKPLSKVIPDSMSTVTINPSQDITLNLHVSEVNEAMKRLGADQLMPESVDGKPITLHIPESVNYNLSPTKEHWATLTQTKAPTITVDPSIKVEEALKAVINFPLLPDYLKSSLEQSRILSGEIPMPIIAKEGAEQMTIGSTTVIVNHYDSNPGILYDATWVQNGQLFQFYGGNLYEGKEKFVAKLQELIQS